MVHQLDDVFCEFFWPDSVKFTNKGCFFSSRKIKSNIFVLDWQKMSLTLCLYFCFLFIPQSIEIKFFGFLGRRNKGSNTGKRARRKNLRHPRERFLVSNEALPSWRPIEIGVWFFSSLIFYWKYSIFHTWNMTSKVRKRTSRNTKKWK